MALHGEIKVNDVVIGAWRAVRKERIIGEPQPLENNTKIFRYECHVTYRDLAGYPNEGRFDVTHRYGDGPLMLTAKVLIKAKAELKPIHNNEISDEIYDTERSYD